jgi:16S rRNA (uracil1498-N3)-methyltransferase
VAPASPAPARRRFFLAEPPTGDVAVLRDAAAHRATEVLRLRPGNTVELFDGSGRSWQGVIAAQGRAEVRLAVGSATLHPAEPRTVLCAGLIRPSRFEWLIEKATELGVSVVQPVTMTYSTVRPDEVGPARRERWHRIAVEAAEQCGRFTVPSIGGPVPFDRALEQPEGRLLVAAEPAHGHAIRLGAALHGIGTAPVTLLTGPEGGLTPDEVNAAIEAGGVLVSLGPRVLRAETAAIACLAILADARQGAPAPAGPLPP